MTFKSKNNLAFEVADWPFSDEYKAFRVGTCHGLWGASATTFDLLALQNDKPGNGHFDDVLEWFENSCRRDGKDLRVLELWNEQLKFHLLEQHGFEEIDKENIIKKFRNNGK